VTSLPFLARMGLMLGGILAWALQFGVLYGLAALACAGRLPTLASHLPAFSTVTSGAALALACLVAVIAWRSLRRSDQDAAAAFIDRMTLLIAGASAVAVVWTALPGILTPACNGGLVP
jgi:hypothetical protein